MKNSNTKGSNNIIFSVVTEKERDRDGFLSDHLLIFQISGQLMLETATENFCTVSGNVVLIRKNQLVKVTKTPSHDETYKSVIIVLKEDVLRKYALENDISITGKYIGKHNLFIQPNGYIEGFFSSLISYGENPDADISSAIGTLKINEAIKLLLYSKPELADFLFDFPEPHKIDLEKFMLSNYRFNVPLEKFAELTGRSLATFKRDFQKRFNTSPRQWLQDKRLVEARYQIKEKHKNPSEIYLALGFESLPHFTTAFKRKFGVSPKQLH